MATTFRRVLTPGAQLCAGDFTVETDSRRARLACPQCGNEFDLPPKCGLDPVGRTSYAVHCTARTCSFWDWCVLADVWSEP